MGRFIYFFPIFIFALGVGISAASGFDKLFLSENDRKELLRSVEQFETPPPGVNQDGPLVIQYLRTETVDGNTNAFYRVTNYGFERLRFGYKEDITSCSLRISPALNLLLMGSSGCVVPVQTLNPSQTTIVKAPIFEDNYGLHLTIKYLYGAAEEKKVASLFVTYPARTHYPK